jgi:hypothetical protein
MNVHKLQVYEVELAAHAAFDRTLQIAERCRAHGRLGRMARVMERWYRVRDVLWLMGFIGIELDAEPATGNQNPATEE